MVILTIDGTILQDLPYNLLRRLTKGMCQALPWGCLWVFLCLSVTQDLLSTFGLDLLFLEGGLLRKSISDFSLLSRGQQLRAAQVCSRGGT